MTRHRFRVRADGYGVHLEVTVEHAGTATPEELERALQLAARQVLARHAAGGDPC